MHTPAATDKKTTLQIRSNTKTHTHTHILVLKKEQQVRPVWPTFKRRPSADSPPGIHSHTPPLVPQSHYRTQEGPAAERRTERIRVHVRQMDGTGDVSAMPAKVQRHLHYTHAMFCNSHMHPTAPHGPHLAGLVKEAAPAPLEQELNVLVNAAARKLPGQMESAFEKHTRRDQGVTRTGQQRLCHTEDRTAPLCKLTQTLPSVVKHHSDASLASALFHLAS